MTEIEEALGLARHDKKPELFHSGAEASCFDAECRAAAGATEFVGIARSFRTVAALRHASD
jgi:hypothetical protein